MDHFTALACWNKPLFRGREQIYRNKDFMIKKTKQTLTLIIYAALFGSAVYARVPFIGRFIKWVNKLQLTCPDCLPDKTAYFFKKNQPEHMLSVLGKNPLQPVLSTKTRAEIGE